MTEYTSTAAAPARGLSLTSFVLGLVSLFFGFSFVVPIIGLVLGFMGLRREPEGRGFALAGAWINGLILAFWTVTTIIVIFAVIGGAIAIPLFASYR